MAWTKNGVRGVGFLASAGVLAMSGFFVMKPLYDDIQDTQTEINSVQQVTEGKQTQLGVLESGVSNYEEIQDYVNNFLGIVPPAKDIESASRSISSAAVPGISITSFTFGSEENIEEMPVPEPSLEGFTPPAGFEGETTAASTDGEATAVDTFHRVPVQVVVTASDYSTLSAYLDNLAQQPRLLSVVSVDSTRGNVEGGTEITATIYAHAFVYAR